jgi:hypothetical protein
MISHVCRTIKYSLSSASLLLGNLFLKKFDAVLIHALKNVIKLNLIRSSGKRSFAGLKRTDAKHFLVSEVRPTAWVILQ